MISGRELANSNPDTLKKELGIVGLDLFFMPMVLMKVMFINLIKQSHMVGEFTQILRGRYDRQADIELILKEIAEQVANGVSESISKLVKFPLAFGFSNRGQAFAASTDRRLSLPIIQKYY